MIIRNLSQRSAFTRNTNMLRMESRDQPRGQVLVIVAFAMVAIIAMVGLVIDGGYAWGRQRDTQNGADSVAMAGTEVVLRWLAEVGTTPTDGDVGCAVADAVAANQVTIESAVYIDDQGDPLVPPAPVGPCAAGAGAAIPTGAQGVKATTSETFSPFLMRIVGFDTLTTTADATAVVGPVTGFPGAVLPVTFPTSLNVCDSTAAQFDIRVDDGDGTWEPYEILESESLATPSNLAIVPLCQTGPGSVGYLDYGCGQTFKESIEQPCETFIYIPDWIQTKTGNMNCCESHMNSYSGDIVGTPEGELFPGTTATDAVVRLPVHQNTCTDDPDEGASDPQTHSHPAPDCDWDGVGNNTWYDIHYWVGFKVDRVYAKGGDKECEEAPGQPIMDKAPGYVSCLKGWFVEYIPGPGPISLGPVSPGDDVTIAMALID